jgi:DNA polymerase III epsilon subunit-like protein
MKKLIKYSAYLVSITILLYGCAGTQDLAPDGSEIPIGVNTIIAHTNLDKESAYQNVGQYLIQKGYSIENTTPEFYGLETDFKEIPVGLLDAWVEISISSTVVDMNKDTQIIFTGRLNSGLGEFEIEQRGIDDSIIRIAWNEFYTLAKSYSDSLTFETR